jgi:hypothetical protein
LETLGQRTAKKTQRSEEAEAKTTKAAEDKIRKRKRQKFIHPTLTRQF